METLGHFNKYLRYFRTALRSPIAHGVLFLLAVLIFHFEKPVEGAVAFLWIVMVYLLVCDDFCSVMLPLLFPAAFVLTAYDGYALFSPYIWMLIPTAICFLFHIIVYRRRVVLGEHFSSAIAVTVALMLGGAFFISAQEYFAGAALYHVLMLGVGMLLLYLLMRSDIEGRDVEEITRRFMLYMYLWGLFASFMIFDQYLKYYLENGSLMIKGRLAMYPPQWKNNISTVLLLTLPFPFYRALKNPLHLISGFLMYVAMLFSLSRGGILMGTIAVALICVYVFIFAKNKWVRITLSAIIGAGIAAFVVFFRSINPELFFRRSFSFNQLISKNEDRVLLIGRAIEGFKSAPIFGQGIGYGGNADLYNPRQGAMYFYHMFIPQVVGSMGLVGILAYLWQIVLRVRSAVLRINPCTLCLFLSYIGVFLMSQVNPGEFVPLPYELITVALFVLIEKQTKRGCHLSVKPKMAKRTKGN